MQGNTCFGYKCFAQHLSTIEPSGNTYWKPQEATGQWTTGNSMVLKNDGDIELRTVPNRKALEESPIQSHQRLMNFWLICLIAISLLMAALCIKTLGVFLGSLLTIGSLGPWFWLIYSIERQQ